MNSQEFLIGEMLNDEDIRIKFSPHLDVNFIYDKNMFIIIQALKEEEFSFEKLFLRHGKRVTALAIEIANNHLKYKMLTTGKIQ